MDYPQMIAIGIGLHNFAEGLAIGQSAASGEAALATVLVVGFGLHNATEGFGIVAPLAGDLDDVGNAQRPTWKFLLTMGVIATGAAFAGGPRWPLLGLSAFLVAMGLFTLYEARKGWCVARAMGFKTPV